MKTIESPTSPKQYCDEAKLEPTHLKTKSEVQILLKKQRYIATKQEEHCNQRKTVINEQISKAVEQREVK